MTGKSSRTGLGILLTLAAMFLFAAMDGVSKHLAGSLPIPQILWVRYVLFTALAIAVLQRQGLVSVAHSGRPWLQCGRALVGLVENGVFVLAFTYLPLADVHAIAAASPLIVIALSVPLLGERVDLGRWVAVLVGFAGMLLIVRPGFASVGPGHLIALVGALLWGSYQIMVRMVSGVDRSDTTWLWTALIGLAATSCVGPFVWVDPDAQGWFWLVAIALFGSLAHLSLIKALSLAEASAMQPFSYTLLLWAAVIGYLAYGDIPDRWTIMGAALILAGGLYAGQRERRAGVIVSRETSDGR